MCTGNVCFEVLRGEALEQQRPAGYIPNQPPYDKYRPVKEELEFMGVEILSSLNSDGSFDNEMVANALY